MTTDNVNKKMTFIRNIAQSCQCGTLANRNQERPELRKQFYAEQVSKRIL